MCRPSKGKFLGMGLFIIIAVFAFGAITMLLWNWLVPALFSGPIISYWQALGLLVLSKILFSTGPGKHHSHRSHSYNSGWKTHLRERVERHSSEDESSNTEDIKTNNED